VPESVTQSLRQHISPRKLAVSHRTPRNVKNRRLVSHPSHSVVTIAKEDTMSWITPAKFVHVVYRTRRFEQMLTWYKTVFNARAQYENPALAFLTYDGEHHRFAFANMALLQPEGSETDKLGVIGVDHVAYTYA
jgi:catechol-2,3-dioxygenase